MQEDTPLQRIDISPGTALKTGLGLAASAPFLKAGFNYAKKKVVDPKNMSKLKNLMNKAFKRFDEPVRAAFPIMNKAQQAAWRKANPDKWNLDKLKLLGWSGAGGLSVKTLMDSLGSDDADLKTKPAPAFMNDAQRMSQMDNSVPEKTTMQKLGDNMKDPKWWTESISGLPSDTRLMRMGQLMDYYGKKPKGRQASTAPAELWAKNEAASQAAKAKVLAAGSGSSGTFLSKMGDDAQTAAIEQEVKAKLGLSDWNPINGPAGSNSAAVTTTVARVKGLIQQYVASGMDWDKALTLAMSQVTK